MTLKVIGAGLGRTGTLSLKLALEQLGFGPCYHMLEVLQDPEAPDRWSEAADGRPDWETIFRGYNATVDWPGASFWAELAQAYPAAKVILTVRDPDAWFRSTQATIFAAPPPDGEAAFGRMFHKVIGRLFEDGLDDGLHDRDHAIAVYERHNAQVRARVPADRLLVYEVAQGWEPLCAFLGVPVPPTPMPQVNSTEEFQARRRAMAAPT